VTGIKRFKEGEIGKHEIKKMARK